jgi:hypothetical protein
VDDLVLVQVHQRRNDLCEIVLHFHLGESLSALQQLIQSLVGADFQQDVDVFMILEDVLELDDVLLAERFVDLDLGDQLREIEITFCLALERLSELLAMILAADTRFVSKFVTS